MRPVRLPISCVLALSMAAFLSAACAQASSTAIQPLRIVTFNAEFLTAPGINAGTIQRYRFDYARHQHLERIAALIEVLNPDILNLVEVTSREAVDQVIEILHAKGLTDYRGYHVEGNDSFTGLDVALITKLEPDFLEGQPIRTYYSPNDDPTWRQSFRFIGREGETVQQTTSLARNALYYITVGGHKLGLLGLHLKSNPQDEYSNARREAEAEVARRILRSQVVSRGYLPIVLGDLNDYDEEIPDRDETRSTSTTVLRKLKDFDPQSGGDELLNVAQRIVRQTDRYSSHWDWNENGAHDGDDVYTMIDHILLPKALMPYVRRVFIAHTVSLDTADHYPVVVDLDLPVADSGVDDPTAGDRQ